MWFLQQTGSSEEVHIISSGAKWFLGEITILVYAVLVYVMITAWLNKKYTQVFASILIGAVIIIFAETGLVGTKALQSLGNVVLTIFGLDGYVNTGGS